MDQLEISLRSNNLELIPIRRPRWLGRLSSCLLKSISRVQFSPSAYTRRDFSCIKIDQRKARERELATFEGNRRAVGMLNPMRDSDGTYWGEGTTQHVTTACPQDRRG